MNIHAAMRDSGTVLSAGSFHDPDYVIQSAWLEHGPFLSWLIEMLAPVRFVELGCHSGYSYFVACQAVKRLGLPTSCYAIDTWEGDEHAGFYTEEVFNAVNQQNATHYAAFSQLVRGTFAQTVDLFSDGSIDLLHIDGRHFYEDVLEDLTLWRPKLTQDAIVLFHDTNVRERGFGVWKLFHELRQQHPSFEFIHGNGLGVVAFGAIPPRLAPLFDERAESVATLRIAYSALGRAVSRRWQLAELGAEIGRRDAARGAEVGALQAEVGRHAAAHQADVARLEAEIASRTQAVEDAEREAGAALERLRVEHAAQAEAWRAEADAAKAAADAEKAEAAAAGDRARSELLSLQAAVEERDRTLAERRTAYEQAELQASRQHLKIEAFKQSELQSGQTIQALHAEIARLHGEHARLLGSLSWVVTRPLRTLFTRHPRACRLGLTLSRLAFWVVTLRFGRVVDGLRARSRLRREEALIAADPMFDAAFYLQRNPAVGLSGWNPARHYVVLGRHQGLWPHPMFDPGWYRHVYPDIGAEDPLLHYIRHGRAEGRNPNAFFDTAWYRDRHPEIAASGQDPLQHFLAAGAARRYDPSPRFPTGAYLDRHPDVVACGLNPLEHYLLHGRHEGRDISSWGVDFSLAGPVDLTPIECRLRPKGGRETALFVTHSGNGRLKPHVRHYLEALHREGIAITLIVAADRGFVDDDPALCALLDGLYVRVNEGWDFACWAHVLRLNRAFYRSGILYWLNDSMIGPVNQTAFHGLLERIRSSRAGLVGLTANHERGRHIQSFFLAFKQEALRSYTFHQFVLDVRSFPDKDDVINAYETKLSPTLDAAGISTEALFEPNPMHNPTIYNWRELLEDGFAFLKVLAVTHDIRHVDKTGWREALHRHGYDVLLADRLLAEKEGGGEAPPAGEQHLPALPNAVPSLSLIAPFNYGNGLGVAARGYMRALMHAGLPANMLPIERAFHIHQRVAPTLPSTECLGAPDIALIHLNPESWDALITPAQRLLIERATHRIGMFVVETHDLPRIYAQATSRLSAIWAPSSYCAEALRATSGAAVHVVPYVVPVRPLRTASIRGARMKHDLGIDETRRVVLFSFDASSWLARKNPHALLRAFNASGLARSGWNLVLKTKHLREAKAEGAALQEAADRSDGVILLDRLLSADRADALLEMADIYASPHSSEGFGLTIAEAMALGKPVLATDFGGSTDVLDAQSGYPIRCTPWRLQENHGPYRENTVWGRVDEDHLSETLIEVADLSPDERAALAQRARSRIADLLSPQAVATSMRASIDHVLGL